VITAYDGVMTFLIFKAIGMFVPLRMTDYQLEHGDRVLFQHEVFELHNPIPPPEPLDPPQLTPTPTT
jgi:hypothetical protein